MSTDTETTRPALPADVTALTDDMKGRGYTIGRPVSTWAVCWCADGQHAGNTVLMREESYNEQAARQLAAHQKARGLSGHAIETVTVTASFTRGAM